MTGESGDQGPVGGYRPEPVGLRRLRENFGDPIRANAGRIAAAGIVGGILALLGVSDIEADDEGRGPSRTWRRFQWTALAAVAILIIVFLLTGVILS